jgi:hypothetical protein
MYCYLYDFYIFFSNQHNYLQSTFLSSVYNYNKETKLCKQQNMKENIENS